MRQVRDTANLVLEAIDLNAPLELTIDQIIASTGRRKGAVMDAVDLLKAEGAIASYSDSPRRFRRSLYSPADVQRAA